MPYILYYYDYYYQLRADWAVLSVPSCVYCCWLLHIAFLGVVCLCCLFGYHFVADSLFCFSSLPILCILVGGVRGGYVLASSSTPLISPSISWFLSKSSRSHKLIFLSCLVRTSGISCGLESWNLRCQHFGLTSPCNLFNSDSNQGRTAASNSIVDSTHAWKTMVVRFCETKFFEPLRYTRIVRSVFPIGKGAEDS